VGVVTSSRNLGERWGRGIKRRGGLTESGACERFSGKRLINKRNNRGGLGGDEGKKVNRLIGPGLIRSDEMKKKTLGGCTGTGTKARRPQKGRLWTPKRN